QAAGSSRGARHLCAIPAALRMESLVRLARLLEPVSLGSQRAGAPARRQPGRARALPPRSLRRQAAAAGASRPLAILVHRSGDEAQDRRLVEARRARPLRLGPGADGGGDDSDAVRPDADPADVDDWERWRA